MDNFRRLIWLIHEKVALDQEDDAPNDVADRPHSLATAAAP